MAAHSRPLWGVTFIKFERRKAALERQRREGPPPSMMVDEEFEQFEKDSTLEMLVNSGQEEEAVSYLKTMQCEGFSSSSLGDCLLSAAQRGVRALVEGLLLSNAPVNYDFQHASMYTPLTMAISQGHVEIASLLLENNARINYRHPITHETVLMLAMRSPNCVQMMQILFSFDIDVNEVNALGQSALFLALMEQEDALVTMLVKHGARLDAPLWNGATPYQLAEMLGMEDAVNAGLQAMITPPSSPLSFKSYDEDSETSFTSDDSMDVDEDSSMEAD